MTDESNGDRSGFGKPKLEFGNRGDVNILDGLRVYPENRQYPLVGHKPFFKIDAYRFQHRRVDGTIGPPLVYEVFERGDAVGVLLYNHDADEVIVVEQFRLPVFDKVVGEDTAPAGLPDGKRPSSGWIIETLAGVIDKARDAHGNRTDRIETPEETAIRETLEETGYKITAPERITTYYSSPGGTSEAIHLFYAEVFNKDKIRDTVGAGDENIRLRQIKFADFRRMLLNKEFVDPKLVIAAYYAQARLGVVANVPEPLSSEEPTRTYVWKKNPSIKIGFKTGDILNVKGVDVWLNPENSYLMLSRIIDGGISASIRWGGAKKYSNNHVIMDTIGNALQLAMRGKTHAATTDIIETDPGALRDSNNVKRLLHLPLAQPREQSNPRAGVAVRLEDVSPGVRRALEEIELGNASPDRLVARVRDYVQGRGWYCSSVLIPLIGTGEGKLTSRSAVPKILEGILDYLTGRSGEQHIEKFWLLVYNERDLRVCEQVLDALGEHFEHKQPE